jgi:type IV secretory pathway VirB4 component
MILFIKLPLCLAEVDRQNIFKVKLLYHFSLLVFGSSAEEARKNVASAMMSILQNRGFIAASIATATDAAFYAQLPGIGHIVRVLRT